MEGTGLMGPGEQSDPLLKPADRTSPAAAASPRRQRPWRRLSGLPSLPAWVDALQSLMPQPTSLTRLMFLPFAAQLLLAMLLVLGMSYQMAGQIINQLTRELGEQIGERVLQEIKAQLSAPRQVNAINAGLLSSGLISPARLLELGPSPQIELELFPGLGYVHVANPQVELVWFFWTGPIVNL